MPTPPPYTTGGTVQASGGIYLERQADAELLALCQQGAFVYILTPRQMGKSSLMVRTAAQVSQVGHRAAMIDLTQLGVQVTAEQWYLGFLAIIEEQLELATDVVQWWQARTHLGLTQRMTQFFKEVLLAEVAEPVVIFVDEIDSTLSLDFTDDFFAAIRYLYVARAQEPVFQRLSFVLIGVATPADLIRDPKRTPFNIGQRIDLTDFTVAEARPLVAGLGLPAPAAEQVLGWLLAWTGGHPYLTQRLCGALVERQQEAWTKPEVNRLVAETFLGTMSRQDNNLQFVRDMLTRRAPDVEAVLTTYREAWRGKRVEDEEQSLTKSHLKLSGVVKREDTKLIVRNPIYRRVFDAAWVQEHLPETWWQRLKPAMPLLVTMLVATVGMAGVTVYAFTQQDAAKRQERLAQDNAQKFAVKSDEFEVKSIEAQKAQQEAEQEKDRATREKKEADRQRQRAEHGEQEAKTALTQAQAARTAESQQRRLAEQRQQLADSARQAETEQRQRAEAGEQTAKQQTQLAQQQTEIAFAQKLAAQAGFVRFRRQGEDGLALSVLLAAESLRTLLAIGSNVAIADADAALRSVILMPRLVRSFNLDGSGRSIAFSPNGKYLATNTSPGGGSDRSIIHIFDAANGREVISNYQPSYISSIAFSPDSKYLATGGYGSDDTTGIIRILETTSGREVTHIDQTGKILSIGFSPDGRYLVTGSYGKEADFNEGFIRVFEVVTGKEIFFFKEEGTVWSVAFSPNGKHIAAGSYTGVRILDAVSGQALARLKTSARSVAFSPDSQYLATSVDDGQNNEVSIFKISTRQEVTRLDSGSAGVVTFSPNGKYLAAGSNSARIFEVATGQELARMSQAVESVAFSPDSHYLATIGHAGTARIVEVPSQKGMFRIPTKASVDSVAFSPDGQHLAINNHEGMRIVEIKTGKEETYNSNFKNEDGWVVLFSPNGKYLATARGETATIFEASTGKEITHLSYGYPITSPDPRDLGETIAFSPDSQYFAVTNSKEATRVIEVVTGREITRVYNMNKPNWVYSVAFSPDSKYLATGNADATARITEVSTDKEVARIEYGGRVYSVNFSLNGQYFATAGGDVVNGPGGTSRIFETGTKKEIARIKHRSPTTSVKFSPDSKYLLTDSDEDTAKLYEIATGQTTSLAHEGFVRAITFSSDSQYFATASEDGTARIFKTATHTEVARISHDKPVASVAFSSDGKYLVSTSSDQTIVSLVHPEDLLAEACQRLHRNLTRAEWRQYLGDRPYHQTCPNLPPAPLEGQGTPISQENRSLPDQWLATLYALWQKVRG